MYLTLPYMSCHGITTTARAVWGRQAWKGVWGHIYSIEAKRRALYRERRRITDTYLNLPYLPPYLPPYLTCKQ
jgi:hypothetical protein